MCHDYVPMIIGVQLLYALHRVLTGLGYANIAVHDIERRLIAKSLSKPVII
jgi:hypothetical protein